MLLAGPVDTSSRHRRLRFFDVREQSVAADGRKGAAAQQALLELSVFPSHAQSKAYLSDSIIVNTSILLK